MTTSALLIDSTDLDTENFSVISLIDLFLRIPAVSIKVSFLLPISTGTSIESLVVPDIDETTNLSSPIKALIKVDLPALGRPIIEIFNESSETTSDFNSSESSSSTKHSLKEPKPIL